MPRPLGRGSKGEYKDYQDRGTQKQCMVSLRYLPVLDRAAAQKGMMISQLLRWIIEGWCKQEGMEQQFKEISKTKKALLRASRDASGAWMGLNLKKKG